VKPKMTTTETGLIAWFASNHVAANLLMLMIVAFGIAASFSIRKQTTPDFELNNVQVRVPYLGAAPQEVEEGVVIKIEEAIQDVKGIVEINSQAFEGLGLVTVEVETGADLNEVLSEIKVRVDAISTFPALTEKPVVSKQEVPVHVVFVSIYGDMDEFARKALAQQVREELMAIPSVNQVQILGDRPYEISVEVSEQTLREYGLTMSEVSQAIRNSSVDLPGGSIKSSSGDILLRTEGQAYTGQEFNDIVLRTFADGTRLTLGNIATVRDAFAESVDFGRFDGEPTAVMRVMASGGQNELETAAAVKKYIEDKRASLPAGVKMDTWIDRSHYLQGRLDMMMKNMFQGALLVFIILALFLRLKVASWVIVGIPVTFFGALWLMPLGPWPVTVNIISLFGFILVLGIVVDDAIIIGESIYTKIRADGHTLDNVVLGTRRVAVAATFGVLTTIAAFAPMLFLDGIFAPFFEAMSMVVILCLLFSLVESKLILPAHLAHASIKPVDETAIFRPYRDMGRFERVPRFFQRIQRKVQHGLQFVIHRWYAPMLGKAVDNRGLTISIFVAVLIITIGLMRGGIVRTVIFPDVPGDFIQATLTMNSGTAPERRNEVLLQIEQELLDLSAEYVAGHPGSMAPVHHVGVFTNGDTGGNLFVEMPLDENRPLEGKAISDLWRERVGEIPGVKELDFSAGNNIGGGAPLSFNLTGSNYLALEAAASELEAHLREFDGVFDVRNSIQRGAEEIRLTIKPEAEALGLNMASLGRQVRQAFYGEEAQRVQRGKDEVKVMVRYPRQDRRSIADLENMRIRTAAGDEVPFAEVAEISFGQSYSRINRQNRKRVVTVSADADLETVEPGEMIKDISENYMPELLARHPGVSFELEGASREQMEFVQSLVAATVAALFLIYALIAIPLRSYTQPLIIMSVIPFGLVGAVIGHILFGKAISMFSLFGLVALAGVVVNDSLIMIDFVNTARAAGMPAREAVIQSGTQRFRAIVLTSLTTSFGLMPIIFEKSVQAQFVIPMAISLSFGILFATVITLFLIPALYLMPDDLRRAMRYLWNLLLNRPEQSRRVTAES
jgi:multidrug efflux pump subunit AcrB